MVEKILEYSLNNAPGMAVSFAMLVFVIRRIAELETQICSMLENCMNKVFEHLNSGD